LLTPIISDESVESNYKLFKQQNGEVFARFIGTNCRSGSPKKQILVKKNQIENLPITANLTLQEKHQENARRYPSNESSHFSNHEMHNSRQTSYMRISSNHYAHVSGNNFSAYSFDYDQNGYATTRSYLQADGSRNRIGMKNQGKTHPPTKVWMAKKN
jgi:hypothetical protein